MKRPDGFERPTTAARPTPPRPQAPQSSKAAPRTKASQPAASRPRTASRPATPEPSTRRPAPRSQAAPEPRPNPVKDARRASLDAARAERRARRDLRRATRIRKQTEKAEVRRFTARRRRTRIAFLVAGGVVAALAGLVALGAFSPLFALREVRVEGTALVAPADVQGVVDDQMGTPLPLLDQSRIASGLARFPLIQSYSLESIPPGTLVVRVVERTPVAVIARGAAFDLVDSAGVTVSTGAERPPGYPLIDLAGGDTASVAFTAASEVLIALPADLRAQVDSLRAATVDDVTLTLASGQRVVWGGAEDSARKAQHLSRLLAQQPGSITEYDVSSPGVGILR